MRKSFQELSLQFAFVASYREPPGMHTSCLPSEQLAKYHKHICTLESFFDWTDNELSDLLQSHCSSSLWSCPDPMWTLLPHFCPPEGPACSPHLDDNQTSAKDYGYNTGQVGKTVFAGRSTSFWIDTVFVVCALNTTTVDCKKFKGSNAVFELLFKGFQKRIAINI